MAEDTRYSAEETTIRTRIDQAKRRDPWLHFPDPVQAPVLALLAVHPLAWAACWAGLLLREPQERLPLLSATLDSVMQGSLFFALALLAQCLVLVPPVLLVGAAVFWGWVLLAVAGKLAWLPVP